MIEAMTDQKRNIIAACAAAVAFAIGWFSPGSIWLFITVFLAGYLAGFARYPIADREYGTGNLPEKDNT